LFPGWPIRTRAAATALAVQAGNGLVPELARGSNDDVAMALLPRVERGAVAVVVQPWEADPLRLVQLVNVRCWGRAHNVSCMCRVVLGWQGASCRNCRLVASARSWQGGRVLVRVTSHSQLRPHVKPTITFCRGLARGPVTRALGFSDTSKQDMCGSDATIAVSLSICASPSWSESTSDVSRVWPVVAAGAAGAARARPAAGARRRGGAGRIGGASADSSSRSSEPASEPESARRLCPAFRWAARFSSASRAAPSCRRACDRTRAAPSAPCTRVASRCAMTAAFLPALSAFFCSLRAACARASGT
jgi:hypothetical protein